MSPRTRTRPNKDTEACAQTHPSPRPVEAAKARHPAGRALAPATSLLITGLLVRLSSHAAFSAPSFATSSAPTNSLRLENNSGGAYSVTTAADLGGKNIKPGDNGSRCLTVKSSDAVHGDVRLYVSTLTDTNNLAQRIELTVQAAPTPTDVTDCTNFPTTDVNTLYNRIALSSLPRNYANASASDISIASGVTRVAYKIDWTLDAATDNTEMNSTTAAGFTWELQTR